MVQRIIIAEGIEIRDGQGQDLIAFLNANADAGKGSVWTYPKAKGTAAALKYEVTVVFTAADLAAAIDTPDAYVVYEGHSRYGQGPAFAAPGVPHVPDAKTFPTNPWGVHFRMGFDATDTEAVGDLLEHSVTPTEFDLTTVPATTFLPATLVAASASAQAVETKRKAGKLTKTQKKAPCSIAAAWREFNVCAPTKAATKTARGDEPLKGRHYYTYKPGAKPKMDEYLVSVKVGSDDLDKLALKCKVFFMASCSSHEHFFAALDRRRKAAKSSCKLYMTGAVCSASHAEHFITAVFKGQDPTSTKGSRAILRELNGHYDSGSVRIY